MPPPDPDADAPGSPSPAAGESRVPPPGDRPDTTGDAARPAVRTRLALLLFSTATVLYGVDRLTKYLAEHHLRDGNHTLIPGVLQLQYTTNPGGAFGLFGGATWLFLAATIAVCAVILFAAFNLPNRTLGVALGLVLGGALGNLTDRFVNGPGASGEVVDFLAFASGPDATPIWPVFNLADSAIVVGAALILLSSLRRSVRR